METHKPPVRGAKAEVSVASQGGNRGSTRAQPRLERPAGDKPSWSAGSQVLPHQAEFEQAGGEGHLQELMLEGVGLEAFFFLKQF